MNNRICSLFAVAGLLMSSADFAAAQWVAYNDCADISPEDSPENITSFGLGRGYQGDGETGELVDFESGDGTGIEIAFAEIFSTGNTVNWAGDVSEVADGSDAAATFGGIVDLTGNLSYNDAPGWHVDLTVSGLDPERTYSFEGTANRGGGDSYADRVTNWSIIGADSAVYGSTPGSHKVNDTSVEFSTGENTVGYVARWTGIRAGDDGAIVIRTTHGVGEEAGGMPGAHAYKGYAGGAFIVREEPAAGGFAWRAFNDSIIADPEAVSENATNIGLGRGFDGAGDSGGLINVDTGEETGVMVAFAETFSEGNTINTARDAADFDPDTDAGEIFGGIVDLTGNMSYNDAPGWYLDLTITGLDPAKTYTFAGTANRAGGVSYADRVTNWSIRDAEAYVYASSAGAHKVNDAAVEFSTGENGAGYVAQWTDIAPGADGMITIRTSHGVGEANGGIPGAHAYKGYGGGVFMLGEQSGVSVTPVDSVSFFRLAPAPDLESVHPNAPIEIVLEHDTSTVDPATVVLTVNGAIVVPEVTTGEDTTTIRFVPAAILAAKSTVTVSLTFSDASEAAKVYSRDWSYKVIDYTDTALYAAIPAAMALPVSTSGQRGFAIRVAAPSFDDGFFVETPDDVDALWDETFDNLANLTTANDLGFLIESGTINYQIDLEPRGNKAGETAFPGIDSSGEPGVPFGMEVNALLLLEPGFHLFNFTVPNEFECYIGSGNSEMLLPRTYTECTNCGGEDGPWFTGVMIEQRGLYSFRIVYPNPGTAGSLEWLEVAPDGRRHLINDSNADAIAAFVPPSAFPAGIRLLKISRTVTLIRITVETPDPAAQHTVETSTTLLPDSWTAATQDGTEELDDTILRIDVSIPAPLETYFRVRIGED
ncbi:MAG: hypothetical protein ACI9R3_004613 [Verrucomicrobiales bacterium]|jgi:hypothetical protein